MNNTISFIHHTEMSQAEIFGILCQSIYLCFRNRILNRFILVVPEYCDPAYNIHDPDERLSPRVRAVPQKPAD